MKILIVGGTGLTGAHAAGFLKEKGHEVTLSSRSDIAADSPLAVFPHIKGNYIENNFDPAELAGFDAVVHAAGGDIRMVPPGTDPDQFYHEANTVAIPRFVETVKHAGVKQVVLIGSYYPFILPEKIDSVPYIQSRYLSDSRARALSDDHFKVCSLNAPFIVGYTPGVNLAHLEVLVMFGLGTLEGVPQVAPGGGMNFIASRSMSEAILSALEGGTPGRAYLVGDENLSWKQYLELFCSAVGRPRDLPVSEDEHPLFPDSILFAGRNAVVSYEPDTSEIHYSRGNIQAAIQELVGATLHRDSHG